jgi:hypothetical protein
MLPGRDAVAGFGTECQLGVRKDFRFRRMRSSLVGGYVDARLLQGVRMAAETAGKDGVYDVRIPG